MTKCLTIIAAQWVVYYLLGAFIAWDLNPATWHEVGRFVLSMMWCFATWGSLVIYQVVEKG